MVFFDRLAFPPVSSLTVVRVREARLEKGGDTSLDPAEPTRDFRQGLLRQVQHPILKQKLQSKPIVECLVDLVLGQPRLEHPIEEIQKPAVAEIVAPGHFTPVWFTAPMSAILEGCDSHVTWARPGGVSQ
jgi:hypothetical protein